MRLYFKYFFWYSFLPLFGGLLIYLCFGSTDTKVYAFFGELVGSKILSGVRLDFYLPPLVRFHLADGIWAFALTSTLFLLLHKEMDAKMLLLFSIISISFYELCQLFDWITGTFDLMDIGFMIAFSFLAFYQLNKKLQLCESTSYSF